MVASLEKKKETVPEHLGKETWLFLKKKAGGIYPEFVISCAVAFVVQYIGRKPSLEYMGNLISNGLFELTMLERTGLGDNVLNWVIWYVQSMLLCMAILYPLLRRYPEMMRYVIMPLTAFFLLGYLQMNHNHFRNPSKWIGLTYKGNLLAMGELCLGAECYFAVRWLQKFRFAKQTRLLLTAIKWICWINIFAYMWDTELDKDPFMLALLCVAVVLAFSGQCSDMPLFQNRISAFLGKFSLPIYLSHVFYAKYLPNFLPEGMRYRYMLLCYVACVLVTAFVVMFLAGLLRKNLPSIKASLRRCFLAQ